MRLPPLDLQEGGATTAKSVIEELKNEIVTFDLYGYSSYPVRKFQKKPYTAATTIGTTTSRLHNDHNSAKKSIEALFSFRPIFEAIRLLPENPTHPLILSIFANCFISERIKFRTSSDRYRNLFLNIRTNELISPPFGESASFGDLKLEPFQLDIYEKHIKPWANDEALIVQLCFRICQGLGPISGAEAFDTLLAYVYTKKKFLGGTLLNTLQNNEFIEREIQYVFVDEMNWFLDCLVALKSLNLEPWRSHYNNILSLYSENCNRDVSKTERCLNVANSESPNNNHPPLTQLPFIQKFTLVNALFIADSLNAQLLFQRYFSLRKTLTGDIDIQKLEKNMPILYLIAKLECLISSFLLFLFSPAIDCQEISDFIITRKFRGILGYCCRIKESSVISVALSQSHYLEVVSKDIARIDFLLIYQMLQQCPESVTQQIKVNMESIEPSHILHLLLQQRDHYGDGKILHYLNGLFNEEDSWNSSTTIRQSNIDTQLIPCESPNSLLPAIYLRCGGLRSAIRFAVLDIVDELSFGSNVGSYMSLLISMFKNDFHLVNHAFVDPDCIQFVLDALCSLLPYSISFLVKYINALVSNFQINYSAQQEQIRSLIAVIVTSPIAYYNLPGSHFDCDAVGLFKSVSDISLHQSIKSIFQLPPHHSLLIYDFVIPKGSDAIPNQIPPLHETLWSTKGAADPFLPQQEENFQCLKVDISGGDLTIFQLIIEVWRGYVLKAETASQDEIKYMIEASSLLTNILEVDPENATQFVSQAHPLSECHVSIAILLLYMDSFGVALKCQSDLLLASVLQGLSCVIQNGISYEGNNLLVHWLFVYLLSSYEESSRVVHFQYRSIETISIKSFVAQVRNAPCRGETSYIILTRGVSKLLTALFTAYPPCRWVNGCLTEGLFCIHAIETSPFRDSILAEFTGFIASGGDVRNKKNNYILGGSSHFMSPGDEFEKLRCLISLVFDTLPKKQPFTIYTRLLSYHICIPLIQKLLETLHYLPAESTQNDDDNCLFSSYSNLIIKYISDSDFIPRLMGFMASSYNFAPHVTFQHAILETAYITHLTEERREKPLEALQSLVEPTLTGVLELIAIITILSKSHSFDLHFMVKSYSCEGLTPLISVESMDVIHTNLCTFQIDYLFSNSDPLPLYQTIYNLMSRIVEVAPPVNMIPLTIINLLSDTPLQQKKILLSIPRQNNQVETLDLQEALPVFEECLQASMLLNLVLVTRSELTLDLHLYILSIRSYIKLLNKRRIASSNAISTIVKVAFGWCEYHLKQGDKATFDSLRLVSYSIEMLLSALTALDPTLIISEINKGGGWAILKSLFSTLLQNHCEYFKLRYAGVPSVLPDIPPRCPSYSLVQNESFNRLPSSNHTLDEPREILYDLLPVNLLCCNNIINIIVKSIQVRLPADQTLFISEFLAVLANIPQLITFLIPSTLLDQLIDEYRRRFPFSPKAFDRALKLYCSKSCFSASSECLHSSEWHPLTKQLIGDWLDICVQDPTMIVRGGLLLENSSNEKTSVHPHPHRKGSGLFEVFRDDLLEKLWSVEYPDVRSHLDQSVELCQLLITEVGISELIGKTLESLNKLLVALKETNGSTPQMQPLKPLIATTVKCCGDVLKTRQQDLAGFRVANICLTNGGISISTSLMALTFSLLSSDKAFIDCKSTLCDCPKSKSLPSCANYRDFLVLPQSINEDPSSLERLVRQLWLFLNSCRAISELLQASHLLLLALNIWIGGGNASALDDRILLLYSNLLTEMFVMGAKLSSEATTTSSNRLELQDKLYNLVIAKKHGNIVTGLTHSEMQGFFRSSIILTVINTLLENLFFKFRNPDERVSTLAKFLSNFTEEKLIMEMTLQIIKNMSKFPSPLFLNVNQSIIPDSIRIGRDFNNGIPLYNSFCILGTISALACSPDGSLFMLSNIIESLCRLPACRMFVKPVRPTNNDYLGGNEFWRPPYERLDNTDLYRSRSHAFWCGTLILINKLVSSNKHETRLLDFVVSYSERILFVFDSLKQLGHLAFLEEGLALMQLVSKLPPIPTIESEDQRILVATIIIRCVRAVRSLTQLSIGQIDVLEVYKPKSILEAIASSNNSVPSIFHQRVLVLTVAVVWNLTQFLMGSNMESLDTNFLRSFGEAIDEDGPKDNNNNNSNNGPKNVLLTVLHELLDICRCLLNTVEELPRFNKCIFKAAILQDSCYLPVSLNLTLNGPIKTPSDFIQPHILVSLFKNVSSMPPAGSLTPPLTPRVMWDTSSVVSRRSSPVSQRYKTDVPISSPTLLECFSVVERISSFDLTVEGLVPDFVTVASLIQRMQMIIESSVIVGSRYYARLSTTLQPSTLPAITRRFSDFLKGTTQLKCSNNIQLFSRDLLQSFENNKTTTQQQQSWGGL